MRLRRFAILCVLGLAASPFTATPNALASENGSWRHYETIPEGRQFAHVAYDSARRRLILFGGTHQSSNQPYNLNPLNEVWTLPLDVPGPWTMLQATGTPPSSPFLSSIAYDPVRDRAVVLQEGKLWALSMTGLEWQPIGTHGLPAIENNADVIYDPVSDCLVVYGGTNSVAVWVLSLPDESWSQLATTGSPPPAGYGTSIAYDSSRNRLMFVESDVTWYLPLEDGGTWGSIPAGAYHPSGDVLAYDPTGDRLVLFGGTPSVLNLAGTPAWSALAASGGPAPNYGFAPLFDPNSGKLVVCGTNPSGHFMDSWRLDLDARQWTAIPLLGTPPPDGTTYCGMVLDAPGDQAVVWDGSSRVCGLSLSDPRVWSTLSTAGAPPSRYGFSAIMDEPRHRMIVFGGNDNTNYLGDVWQFSLDGTPAWTQLAPSGTAPAPRAFHSAIYDPIRQRMIVYGGRLAGGYTSEVWSLSLSGAPAWEQLAPLGTAPGTRAGHAAIYDPVRDRMVMFAGTSDQYIYFDTWALSLSGSPAWTFLTAGGGVVPTIYSHTAIYEPVGDRMIVYGGFVLNPPEILSSAYVFSMDLAAPTPAWVKLAPAGDSPNPRAEHAAVFDPTRRRMVVYGGYDEAGHSGTTNYWTNLWDVNTLGWPIPNAVGDPPPSAVANRIVRVSPNPSRGALAFEIDLVRGAQVGIEVLDLTGRRVGSIRTGAMSPGRHRFAWDLRDSHGGRLAPGVYFARLAGSSSVTRFVTLK